MSELTNATFTWQPTPNKESLFEKKFTTSELQIETNRYH